MSFDPITCWHVDDRSAAVARAFGEHDARDVARVVADTRPRRTSSILDHVKLLLRRRTRAARRRHPAVVAAPSA